jgi:hypothetical protein
MGLNFSLYPDVNGMIDHRISILPTCELDCGRPGYAFVAAVFEYAKLSLLPVGLDVCDEDDAPGYIQVTEDPYGNPLQYGWAGDLAKAFKRAHRASEYEPIWQTKAAEAWLKSAPEDLPVVLWRS